MYGDCDRCVYISHCVGFGVVRVVYMGDGGCVGIGGVCYWVWYWGWCWCWSYVYGEWCSGGY